MDSWLESHRLPLVLVLLAIIAAGAFVWLGRLDARRPLVIQASTPTPVVGGLRIHVSGAVRAPGVFAFTPGDRVEQAISLAGGPADDADLDAVNLASRLHDEQRVHIPRVGERATPSAPTQPSVATPSADATIVDLNAATAADLEALPGIGPVTARRILERRDERGGFGDVDDLRADKLVSASVFEKVRGRVTVGDAAPLTFGPSATAIPSPR